MNLTTDIEVVSGSNTLARQKPEEKVLFKIAEFQKLSVVTENIPIFKKSFISLATMLFGISSGQLLDLSQKELSDLDSVMSKSIKPLFFKCLPSVRSLALIPIMVSSLFSLAHGISIAHSTIGLLFFLLGLVGAITSISGYLILIGDLINKISDLKKYYSSRKKLISANGDKYFPNMKD